MVTEIPSFYAAGLFVSYKGNLPVVVHRKNLVYKLPGGTSEKQTGTPDAYNPHSRIQVKDKFFSTCLRVFGADVMESQRQKIQSIICGIIENTKDFHALQMVIEFIEEVGLIPTSFDFLQNQEAPLGSGFFQYFYVIEEAYTYSKDKESFVLVTRDNLEGVLPEDGRDYHCVDNDIERVEIIPLLDAVAKYNFARNHINPLNGYIISRSRG